MMQELINYIDSAISPVIAIENLKIKMFQHGIISQIKKN